MSDDVKALIVQLSTVDRDRIDQAVKAMTPDQRRQAQILSDRIELAAYRATATELETV